MNLLEQLGDAETWARFYRHKKEAGHLSPRDERALLAFVEGERYRETVDKLLRGGVFAPPKKSVISKAHSQKKRTVYTYSREENYVLKLLAWLLQRYDSAFAPNLYSFRVGRGVKQGVWSIVHTPEIDQMYSYKVDVSNYFNSIDVELLIPLLEHIMGDEPEALAFLIALLRNPFAEENGVLVAEKKGVMAGTPVSTFLANVYLMELDWWFARHRRIYARYSDDIIIFAPSRAQLEEDAGRISSFLARNHLEINPAKEYRTSPGERWTFLGISYFQGVMDISPVSIDKMKGKMRRKARALVRWKIKKQVSGPQAAKGFIRAMNRKFFENPRQDEMTWCRWYFPLINTDQSLRVLDRYMQDCVRYVVTGRHTKANYNFRYDDMKSIGYESLVHHYYRFKTGKTPKNDA